MNQLPYTPCTVTTPIGSPYDGLRYEKGNCGVSIVRSGEAMEQVRKLNYVEFDVSSVSCSTEKYSQEGHFMFHFYNVVLGDLQWTRIYIFFYLISFFIIYMLSSFQPLS